jgi:RNA polymerase sigma-70 factor (ECF subfamily)
VPFTIVAPGTDGPGVDGDGGGAGDFPPHAVAINAAANVKQGRQTLRTAEGHIPPSYGEEGPQVRLSRTGARVAPGQRSRLPAHPAMADATSQLDPADAEEQALLAGLRAGSEDAFETLVRTTGARLLAVARRIVGSEEDARDVLQESYASAFKSIGRFEGNAKLSTWLHRIVVNMSLMRLRTRKRKPEESIEPLLPTFKDDGHQVNAAVEWSDGADVALERAETRAFVRAQIDTLPDTYRTVLLLRDIEEMSTSDVAAMLGTTENAVKIRLHRARQALRALLDERFGASARQKPGVTR